MLARGGGVLTYIKKGIPYSDVKFKDLNLSSADLEMQWLQISLQNVRPIVIINVYRPLQGDYKKCCTALMDVFAKADLKDNTDFFLLGDFDIDMYSKDAASTRELAFTTAVLGLKQQI